MLDLFYTDLHELPLPEGHRFPKDKYRLLRKELQRDSRFRFHAAQMAAATVIARAHDPGYVHAFCEGALGEAAMRKIGFPWSQGLVERTLASVGSTLAAAEAARRSGFGGTLAGGTHHAFHAEGAGYCVFNDIAVAIAWARDEDWVRRVAVIDLDVHQGDGTAAMCAGDEQVMTVSVHGKNNFPFRKQRSVVDIELDDGAGDDEYLLSVTKALLRAGDFAPEVVFYQSGVDALASDKLGKLNVSPQGMAARDRAVFEWVRALGVPVVVTMGGGYSDPIQLTVAAHAVTYRTAADVLATR
ncbi:MAG: histone deacetylase [Acidobacteria bacterium]|nr:histone deacetylase [Acidobacteriota bacterium]